MHAWRDYLYLKVVVGWFLKKYINERFYYVIIRGGL